MNLSHETVLELMALADGELQGEERERAERLVATSEEARRVVDSLRAGEVGAWLAGSMNERASASGADGIADAVMNAVKVPAVPVRVSQAGGLVSVAPVRSRRPSRFGVAATGFAAVLALAAAVALYVRVGADHPEGHAPVASVEAPPAPLQAPSTRIAQVGPAAGVEVNEIDAPSRGVSVFEIPAGAAAAMQSAGASSVVVWVEEDPGAK
jgi:hypothetical protein